MYTRNERGSHLVQEREKIGHVRIGMLIEPRHQLVERDLPVSINVEFLHDDVGHFQELRGARKRSSNVVLVRAHSFSCLIVRELLNGSVGCLASLLLEILVRSRDLRERSRSQASSKEVRFW